MPGIAGIQIPGRVKPQSIACPAINPPLLAAAGLPSMAPGFRHSLPE
jgi:hypothetical protein